MNQAQPTHSLPPLQGEDAALAASLQSALAAKREHLASIAMQGMLAGGDDISPEQMALRSGRYADELLAVLNRSTAEALHARHR